METTLPHSRRPISGDQLSIQAQGFFNSITPDPPHNLGENHWIMAPEKKTILPSSEKCFVCGCSHLQRKTYVVHIMQQTQYEKINFRPRIIIWKNNAVLLQEGQYNDIYNIAEK